MSPITLNVHSKLAKFYIIFYDKTTLPNNLCAYFWSLLFAFICAPILYPSLIINALMSPPHYSEEYKRYSGVGLVPNVVGLVLNILILFGGGILTKQFYGAEYYPFLPIWKAYVNGIIFTIIFSAGIYLLIRLIKFIVTHYPKRTPKVKKYPSDEEWLKLMEAQEKREQERQLRRKKSFWYLLKQSFIAWKDKNCPIIEWDTKK